MKDGILSRLNESVQNTVSIPMCNIELATDLIARFNPSD